MMAIFLKADDTDWAGIYMVLYIFLALGGGFMVIGILWMLLLFVFQLYRYLALKVISILESLIPIDQPTEESLKWGYTSFLIGVGLVLLIVLLIHLI